MSPRKSLGDRQRVSLYLDPAFYDRIKAQVEKDGMTINSFFVIAAENELKKREQQ